MNNAIEHLEKSRVRELSSNQLLFIVKYRDEHPVKWNGAIKDFIMKYVDKDVLSFISTNDICKAMFEITGISVNAHKMGRALREMGHKSVVVSKYGVKSKRGYKISVRVKQLWSDLGEGINKEGEGII